MSEQTTGLKPRATGSKKSLARFKPKYFVLNIIIAQSHIILL